MKERFSPDNNVLKVYLPLHVDRVGRIYQHGLVNVVSSKLLRRILVPNPSKKVDNELAQQQLEKYAHLPENPGIASQKYPG